ncbi:iron only hydrogenase large subunit-like protein [Hydrogenispora ethanolica]|uniref:Iron only hydrogenase large subunit-like protein n=1 Tax=Hydrogenispora ethanolica TaxID=1082276 RepID=A0A4R1RDT7_HYDET|nr:[Fe-Fe] hydrogenase large subunit C-terminal domain-containing protein [Hydrogenispora ethanolica]TCL63800.1 iron only hydrogenase large subunit-like protein [Hydrogenispora ethanolica]
MNTIITSKARCRDCYKCIRHCPVKAIGLNDGQAWVDKGKCILCGRCIGDCPPKAKSMAAQLPQVESFLAAEAPIVFSLAPSYLAATSYATPWKIVAALKKLPNARVEETALGAELIGREYHRIVAEERKNTAISSCCPVIVNLIEKYFPKLVPVLAGLISPMKAHGQMIKQERGEATKVVFIGPCLAKKAEPNFEDPHNPIDAVLTFEELESWLQAKEIFPEVLADQRPDRASARAGVFPLKQGILKVAGIADGLEQEFLSVTGVEECIDTFRDLEDGLIAPRFIEAMACKGGCIGGPALGNALGVNARRQRLFQFVKTAAGSGCQTDLPYALLRREHVPVQQTGYVPNEMEIREVLRLTGKNKPEDETNCGGCGYSSCREKAIAVLQGMAEPEMCIPYMKEKAESFANAIVDTTLNAIIVVDKDLIVQDMNPAAERLFNRKYIPSKGKPLSVFIDPSDFAKVWETQDILVDHLRTYEQYGLATRQIIYPLPKYGVIIGIIANITAEEQRKAKHDNMRREALERASRVIRDQMRVVQNVAGLLGESTAETKATLLELMEIMDESEAP